MICSGSTSSPGGGAFSPQSEALAPPTPPSNETMAKISHFLQIFKVYTQKRICPLDVPPIFSDTATDDMMRTLICVCAAPRGATWILVLDTCGTRENCKKRVVFKAKRDSWESWLGVKMCLSRKRVLCGFYWRPLGVFFQFSIFHSMFSPKILFRSKIGCKNCVKFSFRGCLSWKGQGLVTHVYNTSIWVPPPPPPPRAATWIIIQLRQCCHMISI